jgi:hypothetical protein
MPELSLERATGEQYDVLLEGRVVGHILLSDAAPVGTPWIWNVVYGYQEGLTPTHGYEPTREAAMQAFARSWHRET